MGAASVLGRGRELHQRHRASDYVTHPYAPPLKGGGIKEKREGDVSTTRFTIGVLSVWLLACAILLAIMWGNILSLTMPDPDDYLRLQQVRDWLGGQSFFDVSQYRIDPPRGVPMHWSRIVDLPLGGLIVALRPLLGPVVAERVTVAIVPLITLGGSIVAIALIGVRLADRRAALIAVMLSAATPLLLFHVMPLRIDHHGWQTMLGLFTVGACFDPRPRRGGLVAGLCAALWLAISLEALPMVAAIGALLAVRFVIEGEDRGAATRFQAFAALWAAAGIALFAAFHGRAAWSLYYCDAVSPAWFGPMVAAPALAALGIPFTRVRGRTGRIVLLLGAAAVAAALLVAMAPACLRGPFAALDPVVRHYWYENVVEGLPVWRQPADNANLLIGFPLIGMVGCLLGQRSAATAGAQRNWLAMLALLLGAYAVSLLVQRAGGFAHGCALPGTGYLLARLLDRIGRWRHAIVRVLVSAGAITALSPVGAMAAGDLATDRVGEQPAKVAAVRAALAHAPRDRFAALARMPRSYILTGLDLTPRLLVMTPHSYAGSGHHRDQAAIRRVINAFRGPPEVAHRIMTAHGMAYLLVDPGSTEAEIYARDAPHGLMADLLAGKPPAWLERVALPGSDLRMWRRVS